MALKLAQEDSEFNGILMKKVVPADNSCLFTSIGKYILLEIIFGDDVIGL